MMLGLHTFRRSAPLSLARRGLAMYRSPLKLDLYYDTLSPHAWLAFEVLLRYRPVWNIELTCKPVLGADIDKATNGNFNESLMRVKNKAKYVFQDLERMAKYYKIPFKIPESPHYLLSVLGSSQQQRFLTAVKMQHPQLLENVSREMWFRAWAEDMDLAKLASVVLVAMRAGLTEEEAINCIEASKSDSVQAELTRTTTEALDEGAFGVPFLVVHKHNDEVDTFFGPDRFEYIASKYKREWKGPVPDPDSFTPLETPPDQADIFVSLQQFDSLQKEAAKTEGGGKDKA